MCFLGITLFSCVPGGQTPAHRSIFLLPEVPYRKRAIGAVFFIYIVAQNRISTSIGPFEAAEVFLLQPYSSIVIDVGGKFYWISLILFFIHLGRKLIAFFWF
jgi:hypothetical protein